MWCLLGIDGKNLSTKLQPPGLIDKLARLSGNDGGMPVIFKCYPKGSRAYLVTSWIDGEDLGSYLDRVSDGYRCAFQGEKCIQRKIKCLRKKEKGQRCEVIPTAHQVCSIMRKLAHSLHKLHRLNMVHGDLSPKNLILQRNPNQLVMIDFGSAWLVEHTVNRASGDGTTDKYAAPELQQNQPFVDARSDQFSFGVIWYELLTLKLPYAKYGGSLIKLPPQKRSMIEQAYEPPSKVARRLGEGQNQLPQEAWNLIDKIIGRCLKLEPDKRYSTGRDLLDDVDELWLALKPKRLSGNNEQFIEMLDNEQFIEMLSHQSSVSYAIKTALNRTWHRLKRIAISLIQSFFRS